LYEVVGSLPNTPERQRRELELAGKLFDAGRYEEAIKQAQAVKRRSENRLDALVVMAKSFVQLGLTPEATECFQSILSELNANPQGAMERVLEAKYSYAQFLLAEAEQKKDAVLARQARKLCSDVMIEDIDYRDVRKLSERADALL
jgi:tetratricopeptide (TPR) repeat protein